MDRLIGAIQPYAWGDAEYLPRLQGRPPTGRPEAELWFGAHPVAPSHLAASGVSLVDLVAADPRATLGPAADRFDQFPFLLKILAAGEPLSIQAHPTRAQAREGFAREESAGVAWDSPERVYRDDNHKPELLVALTPFEAKCGFRPLASTRDLVAVLADAGGPALAQLRRRIDDPGEELEPDDGAVLGSVVGWLLTQPADAAAVLVSEAVTAASKLLAGAVPVDASRFEAELAWTVELDRCHPHDIGVVVALLLNHVVLAPGQAVFLDAGNLHAYLRGVGVEIMANSDNVVRGGLTTKHVDAEELALVLDSRPGAPPVEDGGGSRHRYRAPVPEFSLVRSMGSEPESVVAEGPEIVLVTEGQVVLTPVSGQDELEVGPGQAAFVGWSDGPYRITPVGNATWWRAGVGSPGSAPEPPGPLP